MEYIIENGLSLDGHFGASTSKHCVVANLTSIHDSEKSTSIVLTVVPKLKPVPKPHKHEDLINLPVFEKLEIADKEMGGAVEIYIGNADMESCLLNDRVVLQDAKAIHTIFGWSIAGPLLPSAPVSSLAVQATEDPLSRDLERLWKLDQVPEKGSQLPEDARVIQEFEQTHSVTPTGRYAVTLPRVINPPELGESRKLAVKRYLANEQSLRRKGKLQPFNQAMKEYLTLDHAEKIPKNELQDQPQYYLPVHGVFKDSSSSTKVRPVFDASARSKSGASLNDTLSAGPNLYPQLSDVLINFRRHRIAMSADITKMFREILLQPQEKNFHRFIMRDSQGLLADFRMKRLNSRCCIHQEAHQS